MLRFPTPRIITGMNKINGTQNTTVLNGSPYRVIGASASIAVLSAAVFLSGCLPHHLAKYRDQGTVQRTSESVGENAGQGAGRSEQAGNSFGGPSATIYAVDQNTYRFSLRDQTVWESVLNVLMRNYNLTIADRETGVVTTEWDSYYLNNEVYRNKVSIRVSRTDRSSTHVVIHNNVERLRDSSKQGGAVGGVWLPAADEAGEVARIVQNMALVLNQPPPVLPPDSAVARSKKVDDAPLNR